MFPESGDHSTATISGPTLLNEKWRETGRARSKKTHDNDRIQPEWRSRSLPVWI